MRIARALIRLRIRAVWSGPSLSAYRIIKYCNILMYGKWSYQFAQLCWQICINFVRTDHFFTALLHCFMNEWKSGFFIESHVPAHTAVFLYVVYTCMFGQIIQCPDRYACASSVDPDLSNCLVWSSSAPFAIQTPPLWQLCWTSGKQGRPWSDAAFCGVWSGWTLFAQACLFQYLG